MPRRNPREPIQRPMKKPRIGSGRWMMQGPKKRLEAAQGKVGRAQGRESIRKGKLMIAIEDLQEASLANGKFPESRFPHEIPLEFLSGKAKYYVHIYNEYVKALIDSGRASEALGFRTWMIQKRRDFAKSPVGKTIRRAALPKRMKRRGRSLWDAMNRAAAVEKEKRAQSKKPSPKK